MFKHWNILVTVYSPYVFYTQCTMHKYYMLCRYDTGYVDLVVSCTN